MDFALRVRRAWSQDTALGGRLKVRPEDFVVEEQLDENFSGAGEHLYLKIRKTNQNTHWVAGQLARLAGVRASDVGYAGRKDRFAVTTQWFSLPTPESIADISSIPGCELLDSRRHSRKLRPGDHRANCFRIRLRELRGDPAVRTHILTRLEQVGFPNYFGAQRFGHEGANLTKAWQTLEAGGRLRGRQGGLYLSALRSWLFNQVLDRHIRAGNWPAMSAPNAAWTGPLWGRGRHAPSALERQVEDQVVEENALLCERLEFCGLDQQRRDLVARPARFRRVEAGEHSLQLEFELTRGQYATELLAELLGDVGNQTSAPH